eukprot:COSAG02_NODE_346_length_24113_cov_13.213001_25_plen_104_part_00
MKTGIENSRQEFPKCLFLRHCTADRAYPGVRGSRTDVPSYPRARARIAAARYDTDREARADARAARVTLSVFVVVRRHPLQRLESSRGQLAGPPRRDAAAAGA